MTGFPPDTDAQTGIGHLRERSLHAALKALAARPGDRAEVRLTSGAGHGLVIDRVWADGTLIEVQTGSFTALRRKLVRLLDEHPVRVIYPVIGVKWIVRRAADGTIARRKAPIRATAAHVFRELVHLRELAAHPHLTLDVLTVAVEQFWEADGAGSWRRKGWSIIDTHLLAVLDQAVFDRPADYAAFLPAALPSPFTTAELAALGGYDRALAGKMAYVLRTIGVIAPVGKRGRGILYERA